MKRKLKALTYQVLTYEPLLAHMRRRAGSGQVAVLMYHEIAEDDRNIESWSVVRRNDFLRQIDSLRRSYDLLTLDEALQRVARPVAGGRPGAVLTFDDGNRGHADILLPIVEREHIPVTLYVATGHIEQQRCYWFDRVVNALQVPVPMDLDLSSEGLGRYAIGHSAGPANWGQISRLLEDLKELPSERCETVSDLIVERAARIGPSQAKVAPLTMDGVRCLAASDMVTLGAHTHGHELLTQVSEPTARASILASRDLLQQWSGRQVRHFAYPSGRTDDSRCLLVERLGFASAVTTKFGYLCAETPKFQIPRIGIGRYETLETFKFRLTWARSLAVLQERRWSQSKEAGPMSG